MCELLGAALRMFVDGCVGLKDGMWSSIVCSLFTVEVVRCCCAALVVFVFVFGITDGDKRRSIWSNFWSRSVICCRISSVFSVIICSTSRLVIECEVCVYGIVGLGSNMFILFLSCIVNLLWSGRCGMYSGDGERIGGRVGRNGARFM